MQIKKRRDRPIPIILHVIECCSTTNSYSLVQSYPGIIIHVSHTLTTEDCPRWGGKLSGGTVREDMSGEMSRGNTDMDVGWVHPWVGLGWVGINGLNCNDSTHVHIVAIVNKSVTA